MMDKDTERLIAKAGTFKCATCKRETGELERFPSGLCLACYEVKMADAPLTRPDFTRIFNK